MALALFDLDNTLLAGDSDFEWGQYLVSIGIVDAKIYEAANLKFYQQYKDGTLDIHEFLRFAFTPLKEHSRQQLNEWHTTFFKQRIKPLMLEQGQRRIDWHKKRGDIPLVITATNSFVTRPITEAFGVEHLIATEAATKNDEFTGELLGTPCFQAGKVSRLKEWMESNGHTLEGSWFYSDSHNDLPLLEQVAHPIAIDPDQTLKDAAEQRNWRIMSFRESP